MTQHNANSTDINDVLGKVFIILLRNGFILHCFNDIILFYSCLKEICQEFSIRAAYESNHKDFIFVKVYKILLLNWCYHLINNKNYIKSKSELKHLIYNLKKKS